MGKSYACFATCGWKHASDSFWAHHGYCVRSGTSMLFRCCGGFPPRVFVCSRNNDVREAASTSAGSRSSVYRGALPLASRHYMYHGHSTTSAVLQLLFHAPSKKQAAPLESRPSRRFLSDRLGRGCLEDTLGLIKSLQISQILYNLEFSVFPSQQTSPTNTPGDQESCFKRELSHWPLRRSLPRARCVGAVGRGKLSRHGDIVG